MGFYGNITNTSRTSFQFDKIYSSRYLMDQMANSDGVYAGRYVLVNYEDSAGYDYYVPAYKTTDGENFYFGSSINGEILTRFKWVETIGEATDADVVYAGQIVAVPPDHVHNVADPLSTTWEFWQVKDTYETIDGVNYATFKTYSDIYSANYNIDVEYYHTSRGYDSTVWQKTYQDNVDKYVMVAELNTVVPTFDITADAPRMVPLTPHFGADSSNVYYKLHWSPSWGFRVKAVDPTLQIPVLDDTGAGSRQSGGALTLASTNSSLILYDQETDKFLSDETTNWYKTVYTVDTNNGERTIDYVLTVDNNNGDWIPVDENLRDRPVNNLPQAVIEPQAAIYYNKAGFDPKHISYGYVRRRILEEDYKPGKYYKKENGVYKLSIDTSFDIGAEYYEKIDDHILLEPTGRSGHVYESHNGTIIDTVQTDTQELSIMLPALGNAVASMWDLVYGSEAINNGNVRNLDITWENARESLDRHGLRLVTDYNFDGTSYSYNKDNVETVAGALNSVYDLLGMVIISDTHDNLQNNLDSLDEKRIYYDKNLHTFNRKHKGYTYTPADESIYSYIPQTNVTASNYAPKKYYYEVEDGVYAVDENNNITPNREYFLRTLNPSEQYTLVTDLVQFDGLTYAYQDYLGEDDNSNINKKDYVRDPKVHTEKKYYRWSQIIPTQYPNLADSYEPNKYFRLDGFNFVKAMEETPYATAQYFSFVQENRVSIKSQGYDGIYLPGKYLYKDGDTYRVDTSNYITSGRAYYMIESSQATIDGAIYTRNITYVSADLGDNGQYYAPGVYYYKDVNNFGEYLLATGAYDPLLEYFIKNETLTLVNSSDYYNVSGDTVNLIQFHEGEFFTLEGDDYIAVTNLSNVVNLNAEEIYVLRNQPAVETGRDGTYRLNNADYRNDQVSAMIIQEQYYEPNQFHYLSDDANGYTSYILDKYPTKQHGSNYYTLNVTGQPVDLHFYDSYTYYQQVSTNEYVLITSDIKPSGNIYQKNTYYVINDEAKIYQRGAVWNFDAKYVPPTLTLGSREDFWELQPIEEFGRTINTMHGMLLKIRAMLEYDDLDTRDLRTVQGALNTLADKIAQFGTLTPGSIVVVDDYGRLHGAAIGQSDWTEISINSSTGNPTVTIDHKFTQGTDTTSTVDLKTTTGANTSFTVDTTIPDSAGHQIAVDTKTVYLPQGYGVISADNGAALAAGGTYATINFAGADDWTITTADTINNVKTIQITHGDPVSTGSTAYGDDNDQSPGFGGTFVVPSLSVDSKGHIVESADHTVTIPSLSLAASNSDGDGSSVLQSLTLSSGAFTTISVAPANLKLTGFDLATVGNDVTTITANHTVGQALKILDSKIGASVNSAISNLSWNDIKDISFSYTPAIPADVAAFWDTYDQYEETLNPNEDGYYVVEVEEQNYEIDTYYILNDDTYELSSDPYDLNETYYLSFNDFLNNLFNEHTGWSTIYAAGRPETPTPQTYTLESFVNQVAAHLAANE